MANEEHLARLRDGVSTWNAWRKEHPEITPDLRGADLREADLSFAILAEGNLDDAQLAGATLSNAGLDGARLRKANLMGANLDHSILPRADLRSANLIGADLSFADLTEADMQGAHLGGVDKAGNEFRGANLTGAKLKRANLCGANLFGVKLIRAELCGAILRHALLVKADLTTADATGADFFEADFYKSELWLAKLVGANLSGAKLRRAYVCGAQLCYANLAGVEAGEANLGDANLSGACVTGADLRNAILVRTNLADADLTGSRVHGISAWDLKLEGAIQRDLVISGEDGDGITVDNIEVAQLINLLLDNRKIRDVIDTMTSKVVLILGRFTPNRKAVLDCIREELRRRNYLPVLFDFPEAESRDVTETISLLARMARFIVADLTAPSSIPKELEAIVPTLAIPVQPLIEGSERPFSMFKDFWKYEWVLPVYRYERLETLLAALGEDVVAPAELKLKALEERRRAIEAQLIKIEPAEGEDGKAADKSNWIRRFIEYSGSSKN